MIAILMSTYNGRNFLEQQIRSLICQTVSDWKLYIRDDGSDDGTPEIIKQLSREDNRIVPLQDERTHCGCRESFLQLLKNTDADAYMFCDQDDYWLPNKIEISLQALKNHEHINLPVLICTDLSITDSDLNVLFPSMWEANRTIDIIDNPINLRIAPLYTGCTMMFNNEAKKAILKNRIYPGILHDQLASISVVKAQGLIIPVHNPTILYRQHSKNTVGMNIISNFVSNKIINIRNTMKLNVLQYRIARFYFKTSLYRYLTLKLRHIVNTITVVSINKT